MAVYVGTAPVNLIRGYAAAGVVNTPVQLNNWAAIQRMMGYSSDWASFTLCEAFKLHFDNASGNAGPVIAINVLDPSLHQKAEETTVQLQFVNGRATIQSDTIILDTLALADKVEGEDYSVDYNYTTGEVIIQSVGETPITGQVSTSYTEVDPSMVDADDIIGG